MATRTYPRNVYTILQRQWKADPPSEGWPRVDLPERRVFEESLDVCYHASFLTEEGRTRAGRRPGIRPGY